MTHRLFWHGTEQEAAELLQALDRNCTCVRRRGSLTKTCQSHRLLIESQRVLDGLVFARHVADRLKAEEWRADITRPAPPNSSEY